jgi:hypothetical protein
MRLFIQNGVLVINPVVLFCESTSDVGKTFSQHFFSPDTCIHIDPALA